MRTLSSSSTASFVLLLSFAAACSSSEAPAGGSHPAGDRREDGHATVSDREGGALASDGGGTPGADGGSDATALPGEAGELDLAFGTGGVSNLGGDFAYAAALQSDGKIVMVGPTSTSSTSVALLVVRMLPNGAIDTSFGNAGRTITGTLSSSSPLDVAIAIQPDGKILVGTGTSSKDVAIVRLAAGGAVDTSFASSGVLRLPFQGRSADIVGIRATSESKAVVFATNRTTTVTTFYLARIDATGAIDHTFGNSGTLTIDGPDGDSGGALREQPDGKLLAVTGSTLRVTADGEVDPSFGANGFASPALRQSSDAIVQADGKIIIAGYTVSGGFGVARLLANGQRDMTFGASSFVTVPTTGSYAYGAGIGLEPDGRIVAAGCENPTSSTLNAFAIARLGTTGTLDATFGNAGVTTKHVEQYACTRTLLRQADGRWVLAGGKMTALRFCP